MTTGRYRILGFTKDLKIVKQKGEPQTTLEIEPKEAKMSYTTAAELNWEEKKRKRELKRVK